MDEKRTKHPLSELYVTARMVVLCLLVAFIILFIAIGHGDMRSENFRYLIRYLDRSSLSSSDGFSTIYYKGENPSFVMYKGELTVLSEGVLTLFDNGGNVVMTADVPKDAEFAANQSERYITLFSRSEGKVYVYNAFSSVFEASFSGLYSVFAFDDGLAVISSGDVYRTELTLYNRNFRTVYSLKTDSIITSAALSGSTLFYAAVPPDISDAFSGSGINCGEAGAFDTGTGETIFKSSLSGIPLATCLSDGRLYTATTEGIYIFASDGVLVGYHPFDVTDAFTSDGFAVAVNDGGRTYLVYAKGNRLYSCGCGKVTGVCFGEHVYILSQSSIYKLTESEMYKEIGGVPTYCADSVRTQVRSGGSAVFAVSDGSVLLCGRGSAFPVDLTEE